MAGMKSHTAAELLKAYAGGQQVFELDTASDGEDDILLGESESDVWADLESYFERTQEEMEERGWTLTPLTEEEFRSYWVE